MQLARKVSADEEIQALKELDTYGYAHVPGYLLPEVKDLLLGYTNQYYEQINHDGKVEYAGVPSRDKDDKILYNLQNKHKIYIDLLGTDLVRAIAMRKLNDEYYRFLPTDKPNYTLHYYNARSSGQKLDLHVDSVIPYLGDRCYNMQFAFCLEDHLPENGCTTVVPGSHKSGRYTDRELKHLHYVHAKAGDLVCWDSRLWHGTAENKSKRSRWSLIATVGMWWMKPSMDIPRILPQEIYQQLSDEQKQLLGYCALPPRNEFERNNTKCGYEFLKPSVQDYWV